MIIIMSNKKGKFKIKNVELIIPYLLDNPYNYAKSISIEKLVDILRQLSYHYYNTQKELVPDEIYDILKYVLEERDPTNDYLMEIGAPIRKNKVKLPYFMPSLDKIKPTTDSLESWKKKYKGPYVLSDKLDGVSGLLIKESKKIKLYTRGDGRYGQDISFLISYILPKKSLLNMPDNMAIRGEIIMTKKNFKKIEKDFKNARNAVAGLVNSKNYSIQVAKLTTFIGYSILNPRYKYSEQLKKLEEIGDPESPFPVVTYKILDYIDNDILSKYLLERRNKSEFDIDGIVVTDSGLVYPLTEKNPPYAFAFKTILSEQIAEATVMDIEWNPSKHGYLKPRIRINPINLSGVTITYATAFNAKYVYDNKLGPGAVIKIVRSGDVIPHILEVIKPSATGKPKMPDIPYKWTKSGIDIVVQDIHGAAKKIILIKQLSHFFNIMGVKYISEGLITKLVENGYDSLLKILSADPKELDNIEGFGQILLEKIYNNIAKSFKNAKLYQLMAASNIFGPGLGLKKLKLITDKYPNIMNEKWDKKTLREKIINIDGFSDITTDQFIKNFDNFKKWFSDIEKVINISHIKQPVKEEIKGNLFDNMKIVFTGFRNKDLEKFIIENGGSITNSVSKNTDLVIYRSTESSKYKKAKELNIMTITEEEFMEKYMKK